MPESRIKSTNPTVAEMSIGQSGYIAASHLSVQPDRSTFVSKNAELQSRKAGETVRITRFEDGYHVHLDGSSKQWEVMSGGWLRLTETYGKDIFAPIQSMEK